MKNICEIFILFIIYSFIGWLIEVIGKLIKTKKFINRGFLIGPICPIYGNGALLMILLLKRFESKPIILFFMSMIIFSFLEYITSYIMEKIFNTRWWDYSKRKYNLNGRICLGTMIPFGLLGIFIYYIATPFLLGIISSIKYRLLLVISLVIAVLLLTDMIISIIVIVKYKVTYNNINLDATEEINKKIKAILLRKNFLYKRIVFSILDNKYK